jgi:hypothetical protein
VYIINTTTNILLLGTIAEKKRPIMKTGNTISEMSTKALVDSAGRLAVARAIGVPYPTLNSKLNGYCAFLPGEEDRAISAAKKILRETGAHA